MPDETPVANPLLAPSPLPHGLPHFALIRDEPRNATVTAKTLTDLAVRYGWYDQAHFTRDFTALVGVTPGQYRDRATAADASHPASAAR